MELRWRGSRAELKATLRGLPGVLAGRERDPWGVHALFWSLVGNAVLGLIRESFLTKLYGDTGADGIRWAKLAVATLAKRRQHGRGDDEILIETGRTLASLRPGPDEFPSGDPDQLFRIERNGVSVGADGEKAERHQYGTDHMPPRPIVPPDGELPPAWIEPVERAAEDALRRVIEIVLRG